MQRQNKSHPSTQLIQLQIGNDDQQEKKKKEVKKMGMTAFHDRLSNEYILSFVIQNTKDFLNLRRVNRLFKQCTEKWYEAAFQNTPPIVIPLGGGTDSSVDLKVCNNLIAEIDNIFLSIEKIPVNRQLHLLSNVLNNKWQKNPLDEKKEEDLIIKAETFFKKLLSDSLLLSPSEKLLIDKHIAQKYINLVNILLTQQSKQIKSGKNAVLRTQSHQNSLSSEEKNLTPDLTPIPAVDYQDAIMNQLSLSHQHEEKNCLTFQKIVVRAIGAAGLLLLILGLTGWGYDNKRQKIESDIIGAILILIGIANYFCEQASRRQRDQDNNRQTLLISRRNAQDNLNLFRAVPSLNNNQQVATSATQKNIIDINDEKEGNDGEEKDNNNLSTPLLPIRP
ncbi:MAG: hypothetical protein ACD_60C00012G0002 [uncultured bacterium]|nr:MAG: hypothetical protein ACD_60C00012G0002 [uncultured bacterium]